MSYFAIKRPGTPQKEVKKNNKTESCKAIWDYGFHSETYKTTHSSDYTNKAKAVNDSQKPRKEPRDHLWFLCFDDSNKFIERQSAKITKKSDLQGQDQIENHYLSQMKANSKVDGFPKSPDVSKPAGKSTESKLVDILESTPSTDSHGHKVDIFLPSVEQSKRYGVQTWMDYPEKNFETVKDFPRGDLALMRNKKSAQLTIPIAGK